MKDTLKAIIEHEMDNPEMLNTGSEDVFCLIDIGTELADDWRRNAVADRISVEVASFIEKKEKLCLNNMPKDVSSYNQKMLHHEIDEYDALILRGEIHTKLKEDLPSSNIGVSFLSIGEDYTAISKKLRNTTNVHHLYFAWYTWSERDHGRNRLSVTPLSEALKHMLTHGVMWT